MKDRIVESINYNVNISGNGLSILGTEKAADEICQMMADKLIYVLIETARGITEGNPEYLEKCIIASRHGIREIPDCSFTEDQIELAIQNHLNKLK